MWRIISNITCIGRCRSGPQTLRVLYWIFSLIEIMYNFRRCKILFINNLFQLFSSLYTSSWLSFVCILNLLKREVESRWNKRNLHNTFRWYIAWLAEWVDRLVCKQFPSCINCFQIALNKILSFYGRVKFSFNIPEAIVHSYVYARLMLSEIHLQISLLNFA